VQPRGAEHPSNQLTEEYDVPTSFARRAAQPAPAAAPQSPDFGRPARRSRIARAFGEFGRALVRLKYDLITLWRALTVRNIPFPQAVGIDLSAGAAAGARRPGTASRAS
jgi:hypothetical protein